MFNCFRTTEVRRIPIARVIDTSDLNISVLRLWYNHSFIDAQCYHGSLFSNKPCVLAKTLQLALFSRLVFELNFPPICRYSSTCGLPITVLNGGILSHSDQSGSWTNLDDSCPPHTRLEKGNKP